jgi:hypothetical protein
LAEASDLPVSGGRRCLVSRRVQPKEALIRFVVGPDDEVVPDLAERLPGRGLWVSADRAALEAAVKGGLFAKAAQARAIASADLPERVARLLAERTLALLGLAKRAGDAVAGHDKVARLIAEGGLAVLIEARDGAPGEVARMRAAAAESARMRAAAADVPVIVLFDRHQLGAALGRAEAVHVGLKAGALAKRFLAASVRQASFQAIPGMAPGAAGQSRNVAVGQSASA